MTCRDLLEATKILVPKHFGTRLLLQHGRSWTFDPRFKPPMEFSRLKACYDNCFSLALRYPHKYTYVEGLASNGIFPVEHAWCIDATGRVVDPTWHAAGLQTLLPGVPRLDYFGVPFRLPFLTPLVVKSEMAGIFGNPFAVEALLRVADQPELWLGALPVPAPLSKKLKKPKKKK